ncbi:PbsX family transcriptional regulator [Methylobacterium sp. J-072]|uniref:AbrB/MazE/SpoVT family DNA-binding domain-containing protein n=2 Tax=Methylobacteriaceae TaxID=119045 RepID=UPI001FB950D3|nr:PbsX family transcriptional regulator [Methylobacterium sp. J-072]MCJ2093629.1 PbsX family transcriptional regulator [Methylobacterium sp. J-072]
MPAAKRTPRTKTNAKPPTQTSTTTVVTVRRQGGARVMTLPPAVLAAIGADTGTDLTLAVQDGTLVATPVAKRKRRYTLAELLEGAEHLPALYADTAKALEGPPVGDEIG